MVFASRRAATPNEAPPPTRLGITVTRKVGNAVVRNRIKRLVREVFRQHRERLPTGLDIVWVAKQQAAGATFAEVLADFDALVRRGELTKGRRSNRSRPGKSRSGKPKAKQSSQPKAPKKPKQRRLGGSGPDKSS